MLYGLSLDARDARDAACTTRGCLPASIEHNGRYEDLTLGTNVALGAGAALVAGGALWWIVARVRGSARRESQVAPTASAQGLGVTFGGSL